jgi:hypothetical protein
MKRDEPFHEYEIQPGHWLVFERPEWTSQGLRVRAYIRDIDIVEGHPVDRYCMIGDVTLTSLRDRLTLEEFLKELFPYEEHTEEQKANGWDPDPFDPTWELGLFISRVIELEVRAHRSVDLQDVIPEPVTLDRFEVGPGWWLYLKQHTVLFGDGSSAKSLLATTAAGRLVQMGHRPLIIDYEMTPTAYLTRVEEQFGNLRGIRHLHHTMPLRELVQLLKEEVRQYGIDYIIVDSVAPACGGGEAEASTTAVAYFNALRDIGVAGTLSIAHRTKQPYGEKEGEEKPFGSGFWHNLARSTWFARVETRADGLMKVRLANRKDNFLPQSQDVLAEIVFTEGRGPLSVGVGFDVATPYDWEAQIRPLVDLLRGRASCGHDELRDLAHLEPGPFSRLFQRPEFKAKVVMLSEKPMRFRLRDGM